jgi:hypothetical protein
MPKPNFIPHLQLFCRRGSLEAFLNQETGVDQDAILAYLSDGTRLRTDNVRELVGAHDQASRILTTNLEIINSMDRLYMFSTSIIWIWT